MWLDVTRCGAGAREKSQEIESEASFPALKEREMVVQENTGVVFRSLSDPSSPQVGWFL